MSAVRKSERDQLRQLSWKLHYYDKIRLDFNPGYQWVRRERYVLTFTFFAIQKGDLIKVTKQNDNGIWEGELNGKTGEFPMSHVELIDPDTLEPYSNGYQNANLVRVKVYIHKYRRMIAI